MTKLFHKLLRYLGLALLLFNLGCGAFRSPAQPASGIVFVSIREDENWDIYLIQPDGSGLTRLTDNPEVDSDPTWSPDGTQIAFRSRRDSSSDIFVMDPDGSHPRNLVRDFYGSYDDEFAPSYQPGGELFAIYTDRFPFQEGCKGGSHQMAFMSIEGGRDTIRLAGLTSGAQETMAWSSDGRFLAFSSMCNEQGPQLYLWEQASNELTHLGTGKSPAWSPDGRYLAYVVTQDRNTEIFIKDLTSGKRWNLTKHSASDRHPTWSPDSSQLAFVSNRDGNDDIFIINLDGSGAYNLSNHPAQDFWPSWSPVP